MELQIKYANLDEITDYYNLFSSKNVCRFMDIDPFDTIEDSKNFLNFSDQQVKNKKSIRFSIKNTDEFIGTVCIYSIYWHQKRASIGYALKEKYWNKGIMSMVLADIMEVAKNDFGINRMQATVLPDNHSSKKLLIKTGFEYEGLLKQYELWGDKGFVNLEMYGKIL